MIGAWTSKDNGDTLGASTVCCDGVSLYRRRTPSRCITTIWERYQENEGCNDYATDGHSAVAFILN